MVLKGNEYYLSALSMLPLFAIIYKSSKNLVHFFLPQRTYLQHASEQICDTKEIVIEAFKNERISLRYASLRLQKDKDIQTMVMRVPVMKELILSHQLSTSIHKEVAIVFNKYHHLISEYMVDNKHRIKRRICNRAVQQVMATKILENKNQFVELLENDVVLLF